MPRTATGAGRCRVLQWVPEGAAYCIHFLEVVHNKIQGRKGLDVARVRYKNTKVEQGVAPRG